MSSMVRSASCIRVLARQPRITSNTRRSVGVSDRSADLARSGEMECYKPSRKYTMTGRIRGVISKAKEWAFIDKFTLRRQDVKRWIVQSAGCWATAKMIMSSGSHNYTFLCATRRDCHYDLYLAYSSPYILPALRFARLRAMSACR